MYFKFCLSRYKNDDIVLILKKIYKIDDEIIDLQYSKYLGFQNVFIPLKGYTKLYNILKERNKIFLYKSIE